MTFIRHHDQIIRWSSDPEESRHHILATCSVLLLDRHDKWCCINQEKAFKILFKSPAEICNSVFVLVLARKGIRGVTRES